MNELGGLLDALLSSPDRAEGEGADLQGLLSLAGSLLSPKPPDPQPADSAMPDPQLLLPGGVGVALVRIQISQF